MISERRLELVSTLLPALAVVASAWAAYLPALPGLASYVDLRRRMHAWGSDVPEVEPAGAIAGR
jgi:hypothetical protein